MALKTHNPVTSAQRQLVLVDRTGLHQGKPVKALTEGKNSTGGRNNHGHITSRYRGGGHKQAYRKIDFKRRKFDVPAKVERIEYDPNRTGFIALIKYQDGEQAYILAPQRLAVGDTIVAGNYVDVKPGNVMPLGNMPAPLCTISSSRSARAGRSPDRPAPMRRSSAATANMSSCGSIPASSGWCTAAASPPSVRYRIPTI